MINLPEDVKYILDTLSKNGYEAYIVGGCVRDSIMGIAPHDWDITTSAMPEKVKECFSHTFDTGIKHGTVTVLLNKVGYEVTTYRVDGIYEDNRRPKEVFFTGNLKDDLIRRDFTMNAIAYNEKDGFVDLFGGKEDIKNGIIQGVGKAQERFDEDALRMLRAVRFSTQLGFEIEEDTFSAVKEKAHLIENISRERIREELFKLINGRFTERIHLLYESGLLKYISYDCQEMIDSFGDEIIKNISQTDDFDARIIIFVENMGEKKAESFLKGLKSDNKTIKTAVSVVSNRDISVLKTGYDVKKKLNLMGKENFELLMKVKEAQGFDTKEIIMLYEEILAKNECYLIKDLKINGNMLMEMGIEGKQIGAVLNALLDEVMKNAALNEKDRLILMAQDIKNNK